jgi:FHA domain
MVADHLWEALAAMAGDMGTDREALINQALYTFARLNGYLLPAEVRGAQARNSEPRPPETRVPEERIGTPGSLHALETPLVARPVSAEVVEEVGVPAPVAKQAAPAPEKPARAPRTPIPDLGDLDPDIPPKPAAAEAAAPAPVPPAAGDESPQQEKVLVLLSDGRELERVTKDRFLIGRGKHCDLIINSGKVSREHAAIVREDGNYFIEDLGSSNGTWFEKRRIGRRQIHEGDDYFICAEKLSCTFR